METIILYALRYSMSHEGEYSVTFANVARFIQKNIHDISVKALQEYLDELKEYYQGRTEDRNYIMATQLAVAIKRELYDE